MTTPEVGHSLHADAVRTLKSWAAPDAAQETLRRDYLAHLRAHRDGVLRECRPDHLTSSALVVSPDAERVLLVRHRKAGRWLQTGGHCEPGDASLAAAAGREALEETGITGLRIDPVPLLLSRHEVPFCIDRSAARTSAGGESGRVPHHLDVQFLAVAPPGARAGVAEGEDPVRWFDATERVEPTDASVEELIAAARRRLRGTPVP